MFVEIDEMSRKASKLERREINRNSCQSETEEDREKDPGRQKKCKRCHKYKRLLKDAYDSE